MTTELTGVEMVSQLPLAAELLPARLARVDGVQGVVRHVSPQLVVEAEAFTTFTAHVLVSQVHGRHVLSVSNRHSCIRLQIREMHS